MKLKQLPQDFRVEEITSAVPGETGPFAFYRLDKKNWTTPDAINLIRRRWNIPFSRFSYGGMKDRHADTSQYLTIFHGPKRNLSQPGITLTWIGQREAPFTSGDIDANRFILTLRSLSPVAVDAAREALVQLERVGVPNYFDDQRFGSVAHAGQFVAKEMVLGRHEAALKLALAAPYASPGWRDRKSSPAHSVPGSDTRPAAASAPRVHSRRALRDIDPDVPVPRRLP